MSKKTAIIIGAGPAGLTAAYELLHKSDIKPLIFEETPYIGGLSKTINYRGNRIDIGPHRFFSKSDRVVDWWLNIFPLQGTPTKEDIILERDSILSNDKNAPDPEKSDLVMLIRKRLTRIYFLRSLFNYPISLNWNTLKNLGFLRIIKISISYFRARIFRMKNEKNLQDFLINRFGRELYLTFFKDYTEKVWGVPCTEIKPEWGFQRIKGLSITKALAHAVKNIVKKEKSVDQKSTETSLIEKFMYPKFGPGQLWEEVARQIEKMGGEIHLNHKVIGIKLHKNNVEKIEVQDYNTNNVKRLQGDYVFSTMPVKDLILVMSPAVPENVKKIASGLIYRDFIIVGLLLNKLNIKNDTKIKTINNILPDNWLYIQDREVKLGRIDIFNNFSPYMVNDPNTVWLGLEYFCNEGDEFWNKSDEEISEFAIEELAVINVIDKKDVKDYSVIKVPKAYPAYFGSYDKFHIIRNFTDNIKNLYLIGRNGMHKYNNSDHSMLSAMIAVENIINGIESKNNIWEVNTEQTYHENK
ncbi:NAD(P)/FAD-dependent oxidoreductase [Bacteroidota bacterium]